MYTPVILLGYPAFIIIQSGKVRLRCLRSELFIILL
jgi:hypothetical protein